LDGAFGADGAASRNRKNMKKAIAEKWVAALRSKKYKQGRRALKVKTKSGTTRHCCLGVLCELYQKAVPANKKFVTNRRKSGKKDIRALPAGTTIFCFGKEPVNGEAVLPARVRRWAGMYDDHGTIRPPSVHDAYPDSLAELNDDGFSFAHLLDIIETGYKRL
jgi:hypothetical protein